MTSTLHIDWERDKRPLSWPVARRLDYIDWRLSMLGAVQRADIIRVFGVSMQQASIDLASFEREHPGIMSYDKSAKRYVPARANYRSQRGMDDPNVRRALSLLAGAGHPMGWTE